MNSSHENMNEWFMLYDKKRKIIMFNLPYGKQMYYVYRIEYFAPVNPKEYDVDNGRKPRHSVFTCIPVDGRSVGATKRETVISSSPVFPREIAIIFKQKYRLLGIRQLMRLFDVRGDADYWIKKLRDFYTGIRFRGRNTCIGASLGFGNYVFIRVQNSFHRGENTYFLYNIDYVTRFPYRDMIYDLMAVLLKWIEVEPPLSQYGREHVGVFQMYWGLMETEFGVKPVDEGGNPTRHYAYRVYRVRDILDVIGEERVRNTVYIGMVTVEDNERGKPVLVLHGGGEM